MRENRALNAILEPGAISSVFQPIMEVDGDARLAGFECLSRGPKGTNFESARVMFEYVRLKREEAVVDRACVAAALACAPRSSLTLNVHASTLARDPDFVDFLCATAAANGIACDQLTVEVIEHAPPWDSGNFASALHRIRDRGMRTSLDDVGLGQLNFKMILDVRPDFLKLDAYFVESCASDPDRRAVIECVTNLAAHFGAQVIAEGVDSKEAADALRAFGVRYMQGFLFAEPLEEEEAKAFVTRA